MHCVDWKRPDSLKGKRSMFKFKDTSQLPIKGWHQWAITDHKKPTWDCEYCGCEKVRYVHEIKHPEVNRSLFVGKSCMKKLTKGTVYSHTPMPEFYCLDCGFMDAINHDQCPSCNKDP